VVTIKENERFLAYQDRIAECDNLICKLEIKNLFAVNMFTTKKKAEERARFWNQCYRENGIYLFGDWQG